MPRCLDSLLNQTLKDIEIIVVNDASTDESQSVIDRYCAKDSRIRSVLNLKNIGPFLSRLNGLKNINGEYVTFVDGDDYLEIVAYETMYKKAVEGKYNIVACKINRIVNGERQQSFLNNSIASLYNQEILKNLLLAKISHSVWNKLYTREIITNVLNDDLFKEVIENVTKNNISLLIEDQLFNFFAAFYAKSYFIVAEPLYNYMFRDNSLTTSKNKILLQKWAKSAMHNIFIFEKMLYRDGVYDDYVDEMEEMKLRLITRRNRKVLSLFDNDIMSKPSCFEKTVKDLTKYASKDYLLRHIVDAAKFEILQLKKEKEALHQQKKRLYKENTRIMCQLKEASDILTIPKKIIRKIKRRITTKFK